MTPGGNRGAALVTGGAKRIGAALCRALSDAGYDVVIHYNASQAEAETLARSLRTTGRRADIVRADLADAAALAGLIREAGQLFGPLKLLVNNASLFLQDSAQAATPEGFTANLSTNLVAPVVLAQHFAAALGGERGTIVNLIDQRVLRPDPRFFTYTLAKSALMTATKTMAQAFAPRIRVNAVGPGPTLPNIHEGSAGFAYEAAGTLLGEPVSPDEIAAAVLFLASSPHITGQMIAVDSGQHLGWKTPDVKD